jgi:hypothetical protein
MTWRCWLSVWPWVFLAPPAAGWCLTLRLPPSACFLGNAQSKKSNPQDKDAGVVKAALESMVSLIKTSTSSMTSVPKPLKFLGPHYARLVATFAAMAPGSGSKPFMADVLSVLAMSYGAPGARESLRYRFQGTPASAGTWGHEYIRWAFFPSLFGPI